MPKQQPILSIIQKKAVIQVQTQVSPKLQLSSLICNAKSQGIGTVFLIWLRL